MYRSTCSELCRDDPLAPYVTEMNSGPTAASRWTVSQSVWAAASDRGGNSSKEKGVRVMPGVSWCGTVGPLVGLASMPQRPASGPTVHRRLADAEPIGSCGRVPGSAVAPVLANTRRHVV
jgi:hypothetical protein